MGILGDLHLEPGPPMELFHEGLQQMERALRGGQAELPSSARLLQLGDLGGYKSEPGGT